MSNHETYVWQELRRWQWRCLTCGGRPDETFKRRMDADEAAANHEIVCRLWDESTIALVLDKHATVNSTAGWDGSPNPGDPRNIRRVCQCGAVIGWHNRTGSRSQPLSGYAFDPQHREHIAQVLYATAEPDERTAP